MPTGPALANNAASSSRASGLMACRGQSARRKCVGRDRPDPVGGPMLAVELEDRTGVLGAMQAMLSQALAAGGWYVPERRPFLPHVTVARVRRGPSGPLPALPVTPEASVEGSTLALMRSRSGPGGMRYEPLRSVTLVSGERGDAIASPAAVGTTALARPYRSAIRKELTP